MIDQVLTPINQTVFSERVVKTFFYLEICPRTSQYRNSWSRKGFFTISAISGLPAGSF
jgi:hypothetical protein